MPFASWTVKILSGLVHVIDSFPESLFETNNKNNFTIASTIDLHLDGSRTSDICLIRCTQFE